MKIRRLVVLTVVFAGLLAYHNSFTVPFMLDDVPSIVENPRIRHLWPLWEALTPAASSLLGGRPVVSFSLAVNYALGGLAVWGYHAVNLAIHILAGLTLYGVVRRTLLQPALQEQFGSSATSLALAVAVLWTVHPLQTEAVTYVSQRCESLMGLFYLLTLYGFIRGADSPRRSGWFTLAVGACLLGMASKEVMVTAPALVLLYDRTFVSGSFREAWTRHRGLYLGLAGTWLLLGYLLVGLQYRAVGFGLGISWWAYALTESRVVVRYLWLALWPHPLVFDYGDSLTIWHNTEAAPYAVLLAVLGAGVVVELRRPRSLGFMGAWFFIILAPASSVIPVVGQAMAEHRMYLPLAAVVALVSIGGFTLGRDLFSPREQMWNILAGGVSATVALALTMLTIQRNRDYRSELSIWQDTVAKCPNNIRAHYNLGVALSQIGKIQEAIGQYEQALRSKTDYAEAHYNLGIALEQAGRGPEAREHYEQALRSKPDYADAHNNLGNVFLQEGKASDAIGQYEQALRSKPDYAEAHYNLGLALARLDRVQEAVGHWEQALRIKPDYAEVHYALGMALEQAGQVREAIGHYEQALRIKPDFTEAQNALARLPARQ